MGSEELGGEQCLLTQEEGSGVWTVCPPHPRRRLADTAALLWELHRTIEFREAGSLPLLVWGLS